MKTTASLLVLLGILANGFFFTPAGWAQTLTPFTYQWKLENGGTP